MRSAAAALRMLALVLCAFDVAAQPLAGALAKVEGRTTLWTLGATLSPRDPALHPDGGLYFSLVAADRIARLEPGTNKYREWRLPPGSRPQGTAVAPNGRVLFAANATGMLGELDPPSGIVLMHPIGDASSRPYSVAVDARGDAWTTHRAGMVTRREATTGRVTTYELDGSPYAIAFDRRGRAWVTRLEGDKLTRIDPESGRQTDLFMGTGSKPRRIALARDGLLWVSLYGTGKLAAVDPAAEAIVRVLPLPGGPNGGPYAVSVDALGRVWVVEFQANSVAILDPSTGRFRSIDLPERGAGVRSATLDASGRLWLLATTTGRIGFVD